MSVPSNVQTYDIDVFEGIAFDLAFQLEKMNEDGTAKDPPEWVDLTGKDVVFIINEVFPSQFVLSSADGENVNHSILTKESPDTDGKFTFHISAADLALVRRKIGSHHLLLRETGADDIVMFYGTFRVIPFNSEGEL